MDRLPAAVRSLLILGFPAVFLLPLSVAQEGELRGLDCPDWALYFGDQATSEPFDASGDMELRISCRNATLSYGFQLGVEQITTASGVTWRFSGSFASGEFGPPMRLVITDEVGQSHLADVGNEANSPFAAILDVKRGDAIAAFSDRDYLTFDLNPPIGGPGFIVGYVTDLQEIKYHIPATSGAEPCGVNQLLRVVLEPLSFFVRGDARADGGSQAPVNITDAVFILESLFRGGSQSDCDDAMDVNDDGKLNIADAIHALSFLFTGDAVILPPGPHDCGPDPTPDTLGCASYSFCE